MITASETQPPEGLHRLIYASRQTLRRADDLEELLTDVIQGSIPRNRSLDITGLLLAHGGWFVQTLEGPARKVEALYDVIARDPRHDEVVVLSRGPAEHREFADWNMCARRMNEGDEAILEGLERRGGEFDPRRLTGASALRLMRAVAEAQRRPARRRVA